MWLNYLEGNSDNQIIDPREVADLAGLLNLTSLTLDLKKNQITDIKVIGSLNSLTKLQALTIDLRY